MTMNDEVIENIAIRYYSWSDEFPMGAFIMEELAAGKHVTLRTTV
ncbi:hypothetical protein [Leuconostoc mesenteroides]|nr:hypothetical protein [Leuconostoc mesenteroides]